MRTRVSGVLFDVGGVLVALDGVPSLARLLGVDASHAALHRRWLACPSVQLHETGKITVGEFSSRVIVDLGLSITPDEFMADFSDWLAAPLPGAFDLVERIPRRVQVAILSNMSAFHWARIGAMGLPRRFDAIYVSHDTGLLKPSVEAFRFALDGMALPPEEVLFLDDGEANVTAATALGMKARRVTNATQAEGALKAFGVIDA